MRFSGGIDSLLGTKSSNGSRYLIVLSAIPRIDTRDEKSISVSECSLAVA